MPTEPASPLEGKSLFRDLTDRAGLTISMATRIAGAASTRTGRRWASGVDAEGRPLKLPPQVEAALLPLVEEHERALELEAKGLVASRPLRERAVEQARAREASRHASRLAEGMAGAHKRGYGERRMLKENERALRRTKRAAAVAALTGDADKVLRRVALEASRLAARTAVGKPVKKSTDDT